MNVFLAEVLSCFIGTLAKSMVIECQGLTERCFEACKISAELDARERD